MRDFNQSTLSFFIASSLAIILYWCNVDKVAAADSAATIPCINGMAETYPCQHINLVAFMPFSELGGGVDKANDIWGWTDRISGREFVIMGRSNGTVFVEVTTPNNPIYLGNLPTHTQKSTWRDIKVHHDHAYIVSEAKDHGMQIVDLTNLLTITTPITMSATAHFDGFSHAHNLAINQTTNHAYAVGTDSCNGGLHMFDISDPIAPVDVGCFGEDGYTHDTQCVLYTGSDNDHIGKEICLNSNEDTLTIVDVSTKSSPLQLSRTTYIGKAYAHQGWLTEDMAYFLMNDEYDEKNFGHPTRTYIWDVRDLDAPVLLNSYDSSTTATDHNLYIKGDYIYQSNYRAGLRILDGSDVANGILDEVAYFDIYPENDTIGFSGTWSNYPYFESGIVAISSMETGLFILHPNLDAATDNPHAHCSYPSLPIPDKNASGINDTIVVDEPSGRLNNITVSVDISHSHIGDLTASLTNMETETTINLLSMPTSCQGNLIDITLDDTAADLINNQCTNDVMGSFRPQQSLSLFSGTLFEGSWQLSVADTSHNDTGQLVSWCLLPNFELLPTAILHNSTTTTATGKLWLIAMMILVAISLTITQWHQR